MRRGACRRRRWFGNGGPGDGDQDTTGCDGVPIKRPHSSTHPSRAEQQKSRSTRQYHIRCRSQRRGRHGQAPFRTVLLPVLYSGKERTGHRVVASLCGHFLETDNVHSGRDHMGLQAPRIQDLLSTELCLSVCLSVCRDDNVNIIIGYASCTLLLMLCCVFPCCHL